MKTKHFIAWGVQAAVFVCFYFWSEGSAGAGNLVQFWFWLVSALVIVMSARSLCTGEPLPTDPKPWWLTQINRAIGAVTLVLLVWFGCPVLATAYVMAWVLICLAQSVNSPKAA